MEQLSGSSFASKDLFNGGALGCGGAQTTPCRGIKPGAGHTEAVASAHKLKHLTPHHLKHTAAALLWAAGASDIEVQLILGHADIETSKRLYAHLSDGSQDSAAARVEQLREARRAS